MTRNVLIATVCGISLLSSAASAVTTYRYTTVDEQPQFQAQTEQGWAPEVNVQDTLQSAAQQGEQKFVAALQSFMSGPNAQNPTYVEALARYAARIAPQFSTQIISTLSGLAPMSAEQIAAVVLEEIATAVGTPSGGNSSVGGAGNAVPGIGGGLNGGIRAGGGGAEPSRGQTGSPN